MCARSYLKGEQQQKTSDFLRRFISFERHTFATHFEGLKSVFRNSERSF
jgi:hypothetical protein